MQFKRARARLDKKLISPQSFTVKKIGSELYVEGWANKAVVDRGKDIINMDAWNLENYKKVPVILFNHDKDRPIGKAVEVRATDAGLWVKAKLSRSQDPEISRVRDLVDEGILNAFSVGFDAKDEEKGVDGVNNIKAAELYEISIVTLPMNQDSIFSISAKALAGMPREEAVIEILNQKGAWVAEAVHGKIYEQQKAGANRDELLAAIAEKAGVDMGELAQVMAGNVTPVPEPVLNAIAEALKMDIEELKKLDAGDAELLAEKAGQTAPEDDNLDDEDMDGRAEARGQSGSDAETKAEEKTETKAKEAKGLIEVVGIMVPKDQAESAEQAGEMVAAAGYDGSSVQEAENGWLAQQADPSEFVDGVTSELDLGNGVIAIIGVRKSDASEAKDAWDKDPKPDDDESKQANPEVDAEEAASKTKDVGGSPITGGSDMPVDDNPYLAQARQTNILLGMLIQEIKVMSAKLDGKMEPVANPSEQVEVEEEPDAEEVEMEKAIIDNLKSYLSNLEIKLKKLGA